MDPSDRPTYLRHQLAERRIKNILRANTVANARTIEQKISDAGPSNQRIDPHILTVVRNQLRDRGEIAVEIEAGIAWYYLTKTNPQHVARRLADLASLYRESLSGNLPGRVGQALENSGLSLTDNSILAPVLRPLQRFG